MDVKPYTQKEIDETNRAIDYAMTKLTAQGHLQIVPMRCDLCKKEVVMHHIDKNTQRGPDGMPFFKFEVIRSSSLDHCSLCKGGRKD